VVVEKCATWRGARLGGGSRYSKRESGWQSWKVGSAKPVPRKGTFGFHAFELMHAKMFSAKQISVVQISVVQFLLCRSLSKNLCREVFMSRRFHAKKISTK
jgi:hypothetical protein